MANLISYSIPSLVQGISQQPDSQRDPGQGEIQINGVSSIAEGLRKRDNSNTLACVSDISFGDCFIHTILRDQTERYFVIISNTQLKVFDLDGAEYPVTLDPTALQYLSSVTDAKKQIKAVSIADYTYVLNTTKTTEMAPALAPVVVRPSAHECLIWIKAADYGQTYTVNINGTQAQVLTAIQPVVTNGTTITENRISTAEIAKQLVTALGSIAGVTITQLGQTSVIWVQSAQPITVQANDARGNAGISAILNSVQTFTELPTISPTGYQIEIIGDPTNNFDNFYVEFKAKSGEYGEGSWQEIVSPGMKYKINEETMPYLLVRLPTSVGHKSFWFGPANGTTQESITIPTWGNRESGDYDTAPDPSFIGNTINDVFIYKNRLGFLSDENIILSRTREFFSFFPETVTVILDTDPIDLTASNNRVSILRYAVPYQDELIVFSDQYQFRFNSVEAVLSIKTAQITILTQFEMDINLRPQQAGAGILFAQTNGQHSLIREFSIQGSNSGVSADAQDLTNHISSFMPSNLYKLTVNDTGNSAYFLSSALGFEKRIYVYKYFFRNTGQGSQRIQSSWSYWELSGATKILQIVALLENLYLLTEYAGKIYLEIIPIMDRAKVPPMDQPSLLLDRLISTTAETPETMRVAAGLYNPLNNKTTWQLPYTATATLQAWTFASAIQSNRGILGGSDGLFLGEITTGNIITARGDWSAGSIYFGEIYNFQYRFSRFKVMMESNTGKTASNTIRTQVRQAKIAYHESGYFEVHVKPECRTTSVYRFDGTIAAVQGSMIGAKAMGVSVSNYFDGVFNIPIMSKGERCIVELHNATPHPCKFSTCEWIALVSSKSRSAQ